MDSRGVFIFFCLLAMDSNLDAQTVFVVPKNPEPVKTSIKTFTSDPAMVAVSEAGIFPADIHEEVEIIDEKSLFFSATTGAPLDPGGEPSNGVRFYSFLLRPNEKLSLRLEAERSNRVGMQFLTPSKPGKMSAQFTRLDRMPKTLKSSKQYITNIMDEPYKVVLMVFGTVNHWFKLEIKRSV